MVRNCFAAATAIFMCTTAVAQIPPPVPAPPPETSSKTPQDWLNDPNSPERIRDAIQRDQMDKLAAKARSQLGRARAAQPGEVTVGKPVNDTTGQLMGLVERIEPDGALVYNGAAIVKVPIDSFGVNRKGLLLQMTKDEFDRMVARANKPGKS
jgi:hypothetical protein